MYSDLFHFSLTSFSDDQTFLSFRSRRRRTIIALLDATLESALGNNWADSAI